MCDVAPFSVRWRGFVAPTETAAVVTMRTALKGVDERVRLWVDGALVIDQWSSLAMGTPEYVLNAAAGEPYYVTLEYKVSKTVYFDMYIYVCVYIYIHAGISEHFLSHVTAL